MLRHAHATPDSRPRSSRLASVPSVQRLPSLFPRTLYRKYSDIECSFFLSGYQLENHYTLDEQTWLLWQLLYLC
jgi:hypothetical protein